MYRFQNCSRCLIFCTLVTLGMLTGASVEIARGHDGLFPEPNPPTASQPPDEAYGWHALVPLSSSAVEWTLHKSADNQHPDGVEQQMLWLMNRARTDPTQEGIWLAGLDDPDVAGARSYFNVDLAVLQAAGGDLPVATLGRSEKLRVGDVVMAIGNPFGVGQTVTMGIVSATGRNQLGITDFENFIQTDASINPGNSGGALINAVGEVVGINTAIFSDSGGSHGIGFAVPIQLADAVMQQITTHGRVIRGWLGITGQDLTPALAESLDMPMRDGILVSGVLEDGPADTAGIKPGDLIIALDRRPLSGSPDMLKTVAAKAPGEPIGITILRDGKSSDHVAIVAERPSLGGS